MAKASKRAVVRKKAAKQTARKPAPKSKTSKTKSTATSLPKTKSNPKAKAKAKAKAKKTPTTILGGVAKGIAWLGEKVRGVVGKQKKSTKRKLRKKAAAQSVPEAAAAPSEPALVTLNNPLP